MTSRFTESEAAECDRLLEWGLREDLEQVGDLTSDTVLLESARAEASVVSRKEGVVAGLPALERPILGESGLVATPTREDGPVSAGETVARLEGPLHAVLRHERVLLNILCRLSGVATATASFVRLAHASGKSPAICDTRKTTPGWRRLEKYAVRVGGGANHRIGLFDGVLIKDNHLAALGRHVERPVSEAVRRGRTNAPSGTIVEIEVDTLEQLREALAAKPDIVLLDNMPIPMLLSAVRMRDAEAPTVLLEASGGVNAGTIGEIAGTGVDRISVGAITHSAPALDLALDFS